MVAAGGCVRTNDDDRVVPIDRVGDRGLRVYCTPAADPFGFCVNGYVSVENLVIATLVVFAKRSRKTLNYSNIH